MTMRNAAIVVARCITWLTLLVIIGQRIARRSYAILCDLVNDKVRATYCNHPELRKTA